MPGGISMLDTGFPGFAEQASTQEQVTTILNYLYQLMEQLRYTMNNLGEENFNTVSLVEMGETITKPLKVSVEDLAGNHAKLSVKADTLSGRVENLSGQAAQLQVQANSISASMMGVEGRVTLVEQNINGLHITSNGGTTSITGVGIQTGTITGSYIEGSTFSCVLEYGGGQSKGNLQFWSMDSGGGRQLAGEMRLDTEGAQLKNRLFLSSYQDFGLKLQSQSSSSYESTQGSLYLIAAQQMLFTAKEMVRIAAPGGMQYQFRADGIYFGGKNICPSA